MNTTMIWILTGGAVLIIGIVALVMYAAITGKMFSENPVATWNTSEAIFYGACVIAVALFVRGGS